MNVSLTPELEKFIEAKVESGLYTSASEVVREALRLLEEQERIRLKETKSFQRELIARLDAMDRGRLLDPEAVRADLRRKSTERRAKTA